MINRRASSHGLSLALLACLSGAAMDGHARAELLMPGEHHGDSVAQAVGTSNWLALRTSAQGDALIDAAVEVTPAFDALLDREGGEHTGRKVALRDAREDPGALLFLRGLPALRAGPVSRALPVNDGSGLAPDSEQALTLGGVDYQLALTCVRMPELVEQGDQLCALSVIRGDTTQVLAGYPAASEAGGIAILGDNVPRLLWAGDLDHDGRLDLVLDMASHYNLSEPTVFLSSAAAPGELVAPVAQFTSYGC